MSVAMLRPFLSGSVALLVLLALPGCAKKNEFETAEVTGAVLYNGEPLKIGSLLFVPVGGGPTAQANITESGTYSMGTYELADGAILGKHKVMITALTSPGGSGLPEDAINGNSAAVSVIPEKFGNLERSGLEVEVAPGGNTITFDLTDKEGKIVVGQ